MYFDQKTWFISFRQILTPFPFVGSARTSFGTMLPSSRTSGPFIFGLISCRMLLFSASHFIVVIGNVEKTSRAISNGGMEPR